MSQISANINSNVLTIEKRTAAENFCRREQIQLDLLTDGKVYTSDIIPRDIEQQNKIFLLEEVGDATLVVYSNAKNIFFSYCTDKTIIYKKLVRPVYEISKLKLSKKGISMTISAYVLNPYGIELGDFRLYIDEKLYKDCKLKQYEAKILESELRKNKFTFKFDIEDILNDESVITGQMRLTTVIDENEVDYNLAVKDDGLKRKRYYYLPMASLYIKDFAIHIRRTLGGNLVLVKRKAEPVEKTLKFRILENKYFSFLIYKLSTVCLKIRKKKINLFYEKYSEKAEEGIFELFQKCMESKSTRNYFIIDEHSPDYQRIKSCKNVVRKYSLKYYWLFYNTSKFISSDTPVHLNILRSNNKYLRKAMYNKGFIFLQHGITYLKCHGKNSPYIKGREGSFQYIVVGSDREKEVVADMLNYSENQILKTGLPIFSKIQYNHITQDSDDCVAIMLTWKPYEEQLYNFEESSYYQNVVGIYNLLRNYIDESKIIIVGHPKANELLSQTNLGSSLWTQPISKALEKAKLLITDYSSVCYNSFYQGAGVIFYQPDLERYEQENGKLILSDNEYIGKRAFAMPELEKIIVDTIPDGRIDLSAVRTKEFEEMYKTINEFNDGKNIDRLYESLKSLNIV